ncbi:MAG: DUF2007 domain-containing protein [Sphaerochaetaceae bacterium]|nr:DUF2007 domain-containing protein [Sphaerochaetaceae bacterium]
MNEIKLETVYTTYDSLQADMAEALLKSNEIPFVRINHDAGSYSVLYLGRSTKAEIEVQVNSPDVERALEVLGVMGEGENSDE